MRSESDALMTDLVMESPLAAATTLSKRDLPCYVCREQNRNKYGLSPLVLTEIERQLSYYSLRLWFEEKTRKNRCAFLLRHLLRKQPNGQEENKKEEKGNEERRRKKLTTAFDLRAE